MDYAKKLKEYREHELLTQRELAKKLGVAFVSVNRWERGHHEPTMKIKRKIRALLNEANIPEDQALKRNTRIGIIDADLLGRDKHRFPNLVCEKLSAYWKEQGADVSLLLNYDNFKDYDYIFVSKVFTDTPVPKWLKETKKVHIGGTGFYFDKAPNLPDEIEHHMPDYN